MAVTVTISSLGSSSLTVRGLYRFVAELRPDLAEYDEAGLLLIVMDAVRRICRETGLAREVQLPVSMLANTDRVTVGVSTGRDLIRIVRVRTCMPLATGSTYLGTWDANANTPTLNSTVPAAGSFYITSVNGNTTLNGFTGWNQGDIVWSDGSKWQQIVLEGYNTADEDNKPTIEHKYDQPQYLTGGARFKFAQEGQFLYTYPRPAKDMAIEFVASFVPALGTDFDAIPLPADAEDCIVALARYEAMLRPYPQDPDFQKSDMATRHADRFKKLYESKLGDLRAMADYGYGGSATTDFGTTEAGWP